MESLKMKTFTHDLMMCVKNCWQNGPILEIWISYWTFGCKNFICGLIVIVIGNI